MKQQPKARLQLQQAQIDWQQDTPVSRTFDDIYFNKDGGLAETEYVFFAGNDLPQRWSKLQAGAHFSIGETGFGTGLNFLCARQHWLDSVATDARLHFISCERFPLSRADLRQALAHWPSFSDGAEQLLAGWPPACRGIYTLPFDDGRIQLTLLFGDAAELLAESNIAVDSWFLDGFAPSRNPEMWSDALFQQLARCSKPAASFATFTAAGIVRRGLEAAGFNIVKRPGFGRKREMLTGQRAQPSSEATPPKLHAPWFARPNNQTLPKTALVIGAGLAGACTAHALAQAGLRVCVIERHASAACEGSGNPQGALYIKLPARATRQSELHLAGFHHTLALLRPLLEADSELGALCGLLSLALDEKEAERQQQLADQAVYPETLLKRVDADTASRLADTPLAAGGLWYPEAGWVAPARLCQALLSHPNIDCQFNTTLNSLDYDANSASWRINNGAFESPVVVLCTAAEALQRQLPVLQQRCPSALPLKPIRGQVSLSAAPADLAPLKTVVCGEGYISPPLAQGYCFGASFKLHDPSLEVREQEHQDNLQLLSQAAPELAAHLATQPLQGRTAFRATTPDYLPLVGALPDEPWVLERFGKLRDDSNWPFPAGMCHLPGLFINSGHGAKGLISCPISAQLIAALVFGTPLPVSQRVYESVNPVRFAIKKLIRRSI